MIEYVVGFLFNESLDQIALIRKEKPDWQRGKINGIGGKIEENESPEQAMRREFNEEAGLDVENWKKFITLNGDDFVVHFFYVIGDPYATDTMTEEQIVVIHIDDMEELPLLTNLYWMIPMAKTFACGLEDCVKEYSICFQSLAASH
jgi:8-oxo-dGTP diphosphatase